MTPFQTIVMGVFVALIVVGVGVFSLFGGIGGTTGTGSVVIWGTIEQTAMDKILTALSEKDKSLQDATYVAIKPATYQGELINAIAAGVGPDLILLSQTTIGTLSDKISLIPYSAVSQTDYLSSFVDEGQLFLAPQGTLALPFVIDPMVMYWNRDTFTSVGEGNPPQYWNDFIALAPKMTSLDAGGTVRRSAVALGTWDNISHAKAVLSALMMQTGDLLPTALPRGRLWRHWVPSPTTALWRPPPRPCGFIPTLPTPPRPPTRGTARCQPRTTRLPRAT